MHVSPGNRGYGKFASVTSDDNECEMSFKGNREEMEGNLHRFRDSVKHFPLDDGKFRSIVLSFNHD
jgi:hypothetical protein